jgi:hypothetical protein
MNEQMNVLVISLRSQTPKHMRGGCSHYTDTSERVDGNGAQNMVTVQSHEFTNCSNRAHNEGMNESMNQ